jgi:hypothetical protein
MAHQDSASPKITTKRRDLGSFFQRHNRLVTFVGALIVFVTFVFKEGFREQLKELGDSIEGADSMFIVRSDVRALSDELDRVSHVLVDFETEVTSHAPNFKNEKATGAVVVRFARIDSAVASSTSLLNSTSSLLERLRDKDKLMDEVGSLQENLKQMKESIGDAKLKLAIDADLPERAPKNKMLFNEFSERLDDIAYGFFRQNVELTDKINGLSGRVFRNAKELEESNKRWYKRCTSASYCLYSLGWGLGLLGRLYGAEISMGVE